MANVIIKNQERKVEADRIMKSYGVDRSNPSMREAAEIVAEKTNEVIKKAENRRKYY